MGYDSTISVGFELDLSEAQNKLSSFKTEFEGLKQSFEDAPNATEAFNEGINRSLEMIDMLSKKIQKEEKSGTENDVFQKDLAAGLEELSVMRKLFSASGAFSSDVAKSMFSGLSTSIQKELDSTTNAISSMIRSSIHSLRSSTISGMASELMQTSRAQEIFKGLSHTDSQSYKKYIEALLPRVAPSFLFDDYNLLRYGQTGAGSKNTNPQNLIPKSFLQSYQKGGYVSSVNPAQAGYMQRESRAILRNMITENDAALRAAEATSGMLRYSNSGKASLAYSITPQMLDEFKKNLFNDFIRRTSGMDSRRIDPFASDLSDDDQRKIVSRMTSSSAGRALKAMNEID